MHTLFWPSIIIKVHICKHNQNHNVKADCAYQLGKNAHAKVQMIKVKYIKIMKMALHYFQKWFVFLNPSIHFGVRDLNFSYFAYFYLICIIKWFLNVLTFEQEMTNFQIRHGLETSIHLISYSFIRNYPKIFIQTLSNFCMCIIVFWE